jgi:transcriptional regulator with XRE-family HTH domain
MTGMIRIDDAENISAVILDLRAMTRLSQNALVREADGSFTKGQLSWWENRRSAPSLVNLIRLAHAFGYDLALIPREGDGPYGREHPGDDDNVMSETGDSDGWDKP